MQHSPADQKLAAILAKMEQVLAQDPARLEADEIAAIREVLAYGQTLVEIARYEEAKGLFWAHWRGIILGVAAILAALAVIGSNLEKALKWAGKFVQ